MPDQGTILYSASAMAIGDRAILIEGPSGIGKSELCLMLFDRGAHVISDDQTELTISGNQVLAASAPNIAGQLEIRNLGIMNLGYVINIPVALIVTLSQNAPRFIDEARHISILGIEMPQVMLTPHEYSLPIKVEWALRRFGLPI